MTGTRDMSTHLTVTGGLCIATGALLAIIFVVINMVIGLAAFPKRPVDVLVFTEPFGLLLILLALLAVLGVVAGVGLLKRQAWAGVAAVVLAVFSLPGVPVGTAFGSYALWVLTREETKALLDGPAR